MYMSIGQQSFNSHFTVCVCALIETNYHKRYNKDEIYNNTWRWLRRRGHSPSFPIWYWR